MTEAEWLGCEEPERMLAIIPGAVWSDAHKLPELGTISSRKLQLFVCACCRRIWRWVRSKACRKVVELAERHADGLLDEEEFREAAQSASAALARASDQVRADWGYQAVSLACHAAARAGVKRVHVGDAYLALEETASAVGEGTQPSRRGEACSEAHQAAYGVERLAQSLLLRDIIGNPFRPVAIDPAWLTPNVVDIARTIYQDRELPSGVLNRVRLAILADALMDAGCDNSDILDHCRSSGPHVRGCWVIDLILGKE